MVEAFIGFLIVAVIICLVAGLIIYLVDAFLPIDARLKQFIRAAIIIIAALVLILKLLPLINVAI